jgi:hypothetical protein
LFWIEARPRTKKFSKNLEKKNDLQDRPMMSAFQFVAVAALVASVVCDPDCAGQRAAIGCAACFALDPTCKFCEFNFAASPNSVVVVRDCKMATSECPQNSNITTKASDCKATTCSPPATPWVAKECRIPANWVAQNTDQCRSTNDGDPRASARGFPGECGAAIEKDGVDCQNAVTGMGCSMACQKCFDGESESRRLCPSVCTQLKKACPTAVVACADSRGETFFDNCAASETACASDVILGTKVSNSTTPSSTTASSSIQFHALVGIFAAILLGHH